MDEFDIEWTGCWVIDVRRQQSRKMICKLIIPKVRTIKKETLGSKIWKDLFFVSLPHKTRYYYF